MMHESSTLLKPVLLWFRLDLRVEDNPALQAAIESGRPIVPVYILDVAGETEWSMGGASYWWLHCMELWALRVRTHIFLIQ